MYVSELQAVQADTICIGQFELLTLLGQGGVGVVW